MNRRLPGEHGKLKGSGGGRRKSKNMETEGILGSLCIHLCVSLAPRWWTRGQTARAPETDPRPRLGLPRAALPKPHSPAHPPQTSASSSKRALAHPPQTTSSPSAEIRALRLSSAFSLAPGGAPASEPLPCGMRHLRERSIRRFLRVLPSSRRRPGEPAPERSNEANEYVEISGNGPLRSGGPGGEGHDRRALARPQTGRALRVRTVVSPCAVLGVEQNAEVRSIKKAYYNMARDCHPDKFPGDEAMRARFQEVAEAYQTLADPVRRQQYDLGPETGPRGAGLPEDQRHPALRAPAVARDDRENRTPLDVGAGPARVHDQHHRGCHPKWDRWRDCPGSVRRDRGGPETGERGAGGIVQSEQAKDTVAEIEEFGLAVKAGPIEDEREGEQESPLQYFRRIQRELGMAAESLRSAAIEVPLDFTAQKNPDEDLDKWIETARAGPRSPRAEHGARAAPTDSGRGADRSGGAGAGAAVAAAEPSADGARVAPREEEQEALVAAGRLQGSSESSNDTGGSVGSLRSFGSLGSDFLVGTPGKWIGTEAQNRRLESGSVVLQRLRQLQESYRDKDKEVPWIKTTQADLFFGVLILAYAILTGVDVQIQVVPYHVSAGLAVFLEVFQGLFVLAFIVELALRIRVDSWRYCITKIGAFDTIIVFLGALEVIFKATGIDSIVATAIPMRLFRLLRLVRIIRAISVCRELKLLFMGLVGSLSAVFWSMVLLLMLIYLGTLLCVILLGKVPELHQYFGSVGYGLFTHFMLATLEAWPDISDDTMEATGEPMWAVYFIVFVCLSSFALMNLVTGVICEKLLVAASTSDDDDDNENPTRKLECYQKACEEAREALRPIFVEADRDDSSLMNCEEFCAMVELDTTKALFKQMDILPDLEGRQMFEIIDESKKGDLSFDEIAEGLLRLRGSRMHPHSIMLQRDIVRCKQRELKCLADLQSEVDCQIESDLKRVHVAISRETDEVMRLLEAAVAPPAQAPAQSSWGEEVERLEALIDKLDGMHASAKALVADGTAAPAHAVPVACLGTQTEWDESHQGQAAAAEPVATHDVTTGARDAVCVSPAPAMLHSATRAPPLGTTHYATATTAATTAAPPMHPEQAPALVTNVGPTAVAPPPRRAEEASLGGAGEAPPSSPAATPRPSSDGATAAAGCREGGDAAADSLGSAASTEANNGLGEPGEHREPAVAAALGAPAAPRSESRAPSGDAASSQSGTLPLPPSNAASPAGASTAAAAAIAAQDGSQGGALPAELSGGIGARGAAEGGAVDAEGETWVCPLCTLENSTLLPACEACDGPRPVSQAA
ncbi:unnamed protein product [Prorocentrum cordatum]|uniref:Calmodulin n=1 Tax=Prorocentrum cordatum TaxID=2364126 RepID=A0ABN9QGQ7_9DINO|nr:unnamed protein product [Polarella glacialis]